MRMTLQQMVSSALAEAEAREKLAQDETGEKPKGKKFPEGSKEDEASESKAHEAAESKEEEAKEDKEKSSGYKCASASTDLVEKVASALDFINGNMNQIDWEKVAVGEGLGTQSANAPAPKAGPGVGPGSDLMTNMESPTPGMQSTETGQATPQAQPPMNPGMDNASKSDGQTNAATAMETDMTQVPGGTGEQPQLHQEGNLSVDKKASVNRVRGLWNQIKQAADAENPAQISAGKTPLANPDATAAEEGVPSLPGPAQAQRAMVNSNDAAINYEKGKAKAEPKRQMGEVLDEPAQKKSTDPVLHQNLDATTSAGVKLSSVQAQAARTFLRKIAEAGGDPDASPEEKAKAEKLKKALEAKKNGKEELEEAEEEASETSSAQ